MIIAVPYFAGKDPRFSALLDAWVEQYLQSGNDHPFVVLTDLATGFTKYPSLAVDLSPYADFARTGHPMDKKGLLLCAGLQCLQGDVLICDSDAFVVKPLPIIEGSFGMPPDACKRATRLPWEIETWRMLNAGVMFFGKHVDRPYLLQRYKSAFDQVVTAMPEEYLCEQLAWTLVHRRAEGFIMDQRLNWVPHLYGPNSDAFILHRHGEEKWKYLGL